MINGNTRIGFDSRKRVVITYHKFDADGFTQIMNARLENSAWKIYQTSRWRYRWDFSGGGSIPFEVQHGAVRAAGGLLRLDYGHVKYGSGTWELDEATLQPLKTLAAERRWPEELDRVASAFPGMQVHISGGGPRFFLRWETLGANRDRPRVEPLPEPSMLRLYEIARSH